MRQGTLQKRVSNSVYLPHLSNYTRAGEDYISGPYTVVIPAEMTSVTYTIMIMDDSTLENNEQFSIAIDPRTLPIQVTTIDPRQVTVTIMDDESNE